MADSWWETVSTPPIFTGIGTLTNGAATVTSFSAIGRGGVTITPLVGQQVSGTGVAANTVVSAVTNAAAWTMSTNATASGAQALTIGAEPVTLAEAKVWAKIEHTEYDAQISDLIQAAREWVEGPQLKRALLLQGRTMYRDGFPAGGSNVRSTIPGPWWMPGTQGSIQVGYPNLQSIVSVGYIDVSSGELTTVNAANYLSTAGAVPGRVMPQFGTVWPLSRPVQDAVQVTYTAGYGARPSDIPAGIRINIRAMVQACIDQPGMFQSGFGLRLKETGIYERLLDGERLGGYW